jgi:hypothetical protein
MMTTQHMLVSDEKLKVLGTSKGVPDYDLMTFPRCAAKEALELYFCQIRDA